MMIMLVIMIVGIVTFLTAALSSSALKSARDQQAADVLVQARDALIGRAVADANHPGSLPCPDNSAPGSPLWGTAPGPTAAGGHCPSYIGRLPWKTLGIPELRDANGEDLWYALSPTLRDNAAAQPINSDTPGWLSLTGTITLNNVAAVVFAPGAAICGQSRSATATVNQYLETLGTISTAGPTAITVRAASNDCSNLPYNDNLLAITADQLFQPVEKRIVREAKTCMDNYAAGSVNKYPWPAPASDLTYTSSSGTLFGRIPTQPTVNTTTTTPATSSSDPNVVALLNALANLQTAETNCQSNDNLQSALSNAGHALLNALGNITNPPFTTSFINNATSAGNAAINPISGNSACDYIQNHPSTNPVQTYLNSANSALSGINITTITQEDASMQPTWRGGCFVAGTYWSDWENLVFYQVADGFRPNGLLTCNNNCLSVVGSASNSAGSGSYRAVLLLARKYIGTDAPPSRTASNVMTYLEPINLLPSAISTNIPPYNTFRPTDASFQTVNDLAQCLDGYVNCK